MFIYNKYTSVAIIFGIKPSDLHVPKWEIASVLYFIHFVNLSRNTYCAVIMNTYRHV